MRLKYVYRKNEAISDIREHQPSVDVIRKKINAVNNATANVPETSGNISVYPYVTHNGVVAPSVEYSSLATGHLGNMAPSNEIGNRMRTNANP